MSAASALYQSIHDTASKFVLSYRSSSSLTTPNVKDASVLSMRSPTCKRYLAPASFLALTGIPASQSNEEYVERLAPMYPLLQSWSVEIKDILVDETKRSAVAWSDHSMRLKGRDAIILEFMWILTMDKAGEKVENVIEFIDIEESLRFMNVMGEVAEVSESDRTR